MAETNNNSNNNNNKSRKRKLLQDNGDQKEPEPLVAPPITEAADKESAAEPQSLPSTSQQAKLDAKRKIVKPRVRAKKQLKPSDFRRLCRVPSQRSLSQPNADAEVVYTNSNFGLQSNPCSRSAFNSNTHVAQVSPLQPLPQRRRRNKPRAKPTNGITKSKRTAPVKRQPLSKAKRQAQLAREQRYVAMSLLNTELAVNMSGLDCPTLPVPPYQCVCTEVNGWIFKLMDLSEGPMKFARPLPMQPRLSTKRKVGKRPTNDR